MHKTLLNKHVLIDICYKHYVIKKIMVPHEVYMQIQKFTTKLDLRDNGFDISDHSRTSTDSTSKKASLT